MGTQSLPDQLPLTSQSVILLTNFVPPYRIPVFRALQSRVRTFLVLISTPMERNRPWSPDFEGLNVIVQRNITFRHTPRHPHGFRDELEVHIPYDTLWQLLRIQPTVVIAGELGIRTLLALFYRKLHPSSRLIVWATVSEASEGGRGRLRRFVRRRVLSRVDGVVVNGASGGRYVAQFGVRNNSIFVAPQAIDVCRFCALPLQREPGEDRRLLYVGQLIERKGLLPFVSVLSSWAAAHPASNLELWLVGDGPARIGLQEISVPPNLVLRFIGNVGYEELPCFYAQAGILALPTLADEWGLVVNEAMASGLPVLGSLYSQAVEELVEEGLTGWTFRPDRAEEMYKALDRALTTSYEKLQEMRASARKRVEHLTPEFAADRILQAIHHVQSDCDVSNQGKRKSVQVS